MCMWRWLVDSFGRSTNALQFEQWVLQFDGIIHLMRSVQPPVLCCDFGEDLRFCHTTHKGDIGHVALL